MPYLHFKFNRFKINFLAASSSFNRSTDNNNLVYFNLDTSSTEFSRNFLLPRVSVKEILRADGGHYILIVLELETFSYGIYSSLCHFGFIKKLVTFSCSSYFLKAIVSFSIPHLQASKMNFLKRHVSIVFNCDAGSIFLLQVTTLPKVGAVKRSLFFQIQWSHLDC